MRKINKALLITAVLPVVLPFAYIGTRNMISESNAGYNHTSSCSWNHYNFVAPSYENNGILEYWVCCSHHEYTLTKPTTGSISNAGTPNQTFINSLGDNDPRVILSYKKEVDSVISAIDNLPKDYEMNFESIKTINSVMARYEELGSDLQAYVTNYSLLTSAKEYWENKYPTILDAQDYVITNREYGTSTYSITNTTDDEIGHVYKLSNITGKDTLWFYSNSDIALDSYSKIYFYLRSSQKKQIQYRVGTDYNSKGYVQCEANEWTLFSIDLTSTPMSNFKDLGLVHWVGGNSQFTLSFTIEIGSFYGEKTDCKLGTKIFDASTETFVPNIYDADITCTHTYDSQINSNVLVCSNMSNTSDGLWLKPNLDKTIQQYEYIYFYFKTSIDIGIEVRETTTYNISEVLDMKANNWKKVVLEVNSTNFSHKNIYDLGLDNWYTHTVEQAGTWYISDIYGVGSVSIDGYEFINELCVPEITSNKQIDFTAYATPPMRSTSVADQIYRDAVKAGFTKGIGLHDGRNSSIQSEFETALQDYLSYHFLGIGLEDDKATLIDVIDRFCAAIESSNSSAIYYAKKNGLGYYALNCLMYDFRGFCGDKSYDNDEYMTVMNEILAKSNYLSSDNYYGQFYMDEPDVSDDLTNAKTFIEKYQTLTSGEPLINLLPLGDDGSRSDYNTYLNNYFTKIYPLVGYASFDKYPVLNSGVMNTHLLNLELFAQKIKTYGSGELRTFVYNNNASDNAIAVNDSEDDLRFQIYSNLAFGSNDIAYFVYCNSDDAGLVKYTDYSHNASYDYAKTVNNEVHNFEKAYCNFTWDGIIAKGSCNQFSKLENKVTSYGKLTNVSGSTNTLVGCFKDNSSNNAFMVMNYQNTNESNNVDSVTLTFDGSANSAIVYMDGEKFATKLTNNQLTINIKASHGAFVIPVNSL